MSRLVRRQVPLEGVLEFLLPVGVGRERMAGHRAARRVKLEELLGHVAHGLLDLLLGLLPGGATKPIEGGASGARVLLHEIQALDGNEELVVAVIPELEELLDDIAVADRELLEPNELANAVINVNDKIADLQVAKIREERCSERPLAAGRGASSVLFENVGLGVDL